MRVVPCLFVAAALAAPAFAAGTPPVVRGTPRTHRSACALGASMASRFGGAKVDRDTAEKTCRALLPTMDAADAAEFLRCCVQQFEENSGGTRPGGKQCL